MADQKHLTQEQRLIIQDMLSRKSSFTDIANTLGKHPSTIAKEIKKHLSFIKIGYWHVKFNACANRHNCEKRHVCNICNADRKYKKCKSCAVCNRFCDEFVEEICPKLLKPPYVCNGCFMRISGCTLEKRYYYADNAQKEYAELLSESRSGFAFSEEEIRKLDAFISPLLRKSQSPHNICITNKDSLMISESTIYRLVDAGVFSARNLDLPRKVRFRIRKHTQSLKVDKACRINRTYDDFKHFLEEHPGMPVTELDSVEGTKGGKTLLTIHFVKAELMLAFLRDRNDSQSVINIFNRLYGILGHDIFVNILPLCLPDNGSEFSNPTAIEFDDDGLRRTHVFYCDPSAPYQKGSAERNHEFIRMFIPKGVDFSVYTQDDISLMMDHINSYCRKNLGDKCPYDMFAFLYGEKILDLLGCHKISPQNVTLNKSVFCREVSAL